MAKLKHKPASTSHRKVGTASTRRIGRSTLGGWVADKIHQRIANGRLLFAAFSLIISTVTTAWIAVYTQV